MSLNDDKDQVVKDCIDKLGYIDEGTALYLDTDWDAVEAWENQPEQFRYKHEMALEAGMSEELMRKFGFWYDDF